ncbi:MAG: nucleotidyltransferase family protein [Acidimicrobiia bacterium]
MASPTFEELLASLKRAAAVLRDADIPFAVGGGFATWARGAPPSDHDVDLMIKEGDVESAVAALGRAGMRPERPPEDWLMKVYDGDCMIDLIFRPTGLPINDEVLAEVPTCKVEAMELPVLRVEDVLVTKLLSLTEHHLDYGGILEPARALREQVDWEEVRARTKKSPFARAFFTLAEDLGIIDG